MAELLAVRGMENTSPAFRRELVRVAERLDANVDDLASVMSFETAGSMSPSQKHLGGGKAVGLIQFMPTTAKNLGTSRDELLGMSGVEQLAFVEKYLAPVRGRLKTTGDHYMAVFAPIGIGMSPGFALYKCGGEGLTDGVIDVSKCSSAYRMNRRLDTNVDGIISKIEAAMPVMAIKLAAQRRPRVQVDMTAKDKPIKRDDKTPVTEPEGLLSLDRPRGLSRLAKAAGVALAAAGLYAAVMMRKTKERRAG